MLPCFATSQRAHALVQVRFRPEERLVLVGHSHYFRELFRHFCAEGCELVDADGSAAKAELLHSKKLSNCGVAKCELDFTAEGAPVVSVKLLFGTRLVS